MIHSGLIKIWYITSKPKLAELEVEVKLYIVIIIIIRYTNLYTEPGIEATACARELLYVYVYVCIPLCLLCQADVICINKLPRPSYRKVIGVEVEECW